MNTKETIESRLIDYGIKTPSLRNKLLELIKHVRDFDEAMPPYLEGCQVRDLDDDDCDIHILSTKRRQIRDATEGVYERVAKQHSEVVEQLVDEYSDR